MLLKKIAVGFGIAVILPTLVYYGINCFCVKPEPQHFFVVGLAVGVAAIIGGFLVKIDAVGVGCILGGIFTLMEGYGSYWYLLSKQMKFTSLLAAFIALIVMAILKFNKKPS